MDMDLLDFGRRYLGPLLELLAGWTLLVYEVLRALGSVQAKQKGRYRGGGIAVVAGGAAVGRLGEVLGTASSVVKQRER